MQNIHNKIVSRINGSGRGSVFAIKDFLDICSNDTVKKNLLRLRYAGKLQHLSPGVYYFPEISKLLGTSLSPSIDKVADAIARKNKMNILITESLAANLLGLTTQIPTQNIFLTDGKSKTVSIGNQKIVFKHAAPKSMQLSKHKSGIVVQALKYFGKDRITLDMINSLKNSLPDTIRQDLNKCRDLAPDWTRSYLDEIALR